jgi:hypothetical protein
MCMLRLEPNVACEQHVYFVVCFESILFLFAKFDWINNSFKHLLFIFLLKYKQGYYKVEIKTSFSYLLCVSVRARWGSHFENYYLLFI